MIVTLTGAYRNVGDHLIGDRALRLLKDYVEEDIISIDRKDIQAQTYDLFDKAQTIILCGGPAYQSNIYPDIYPLDLDKITTKVVPLGLGWKGGLHETPQEFRFSPNAESFIRKLHNSIEFSSCRDHRTVDVLSQLQIDNALMTGCPAWFDLNCSQQNFETRSLENIVVSDAALDTRTCLAVIRHVADRFPSARLTFALHHGYYPRLGRKGASFAAQHMLAAAYAKARGFKIRNLSSDLNAMKNLYDSCNLHVGYRVHAHIYCLSARTASILISEDSRGIAQSEALKCPIRRSDDADLIEQLDGDIASVLDNSATHFSDTLAAMQEALDTMRLFLRSI